MNGKGYFITGTDTGVGKTWISAALVRKCADDGMRTAGMKPIASGCEAREGQLVNDDALALQAASNIDLAYAEVNPYAFAPPIAPHLAAEQSGITIDLERIAAVHQGLAIRADLTIVEGVGGWQVPLNASQSVADLARRLDLPVILVVGLRLGCINHALLTAESIRHYGCRLVGWVANTIDPTMDERDANIAAIARRIDAPLLGVIPQLSESERGTIPSLLVLPITVPRT